MFPEHSVEVVDTLLEKTGRLILGLVSKNSHFSTSRSSFVPLPTFFFKAMTLRSGSIPTVERGYKKRSERIME